jgi:hypothetical protein
MSLVKNEEKWTFLMCDNIKVDAREIAFVTHT